MPDYYETLEVSRDATQEDIKRSYRTLALSLHPDKAGPQGAVRFVEVKKAYDVLSDLNKRSIYDQFGEVGLEAIEDSTEFRSSFILESAVFGSVVFAFMVVILVLMMVFLALLGEYVDGHLSPSWNYVKVFSTLFVVAGLVAISALLIMAMAFCLCSKITICATLAILCLSVLMILIPIVKHRNEKNVRCNRAKHNPGLNGCLQWRIWLCPAYLMTLLLFLMSVQYAFSSLKRVSVLRKIGLRKFAAGLSFRVVSYLLQVFSAVAFFVLVGYRADEVIKVNYFVSVGVPFFVFGFSFLMGSLVQVLLLEKTFSEVDDSHITHINSTCESSVPEFRHHKSASDATRNRGQKNNEASRERDGNAHSSSLPVDERASGNAASRNTVHTEGNAETKQSDSQLIGPLIFYLVVKLVFICLVLATVIMLCIRLNYYDRWGTYDGTFSLRKVLIPLQILLSFITLLVIFALCIVWCSVCKMKSSEYDAAPAREAARASDPSELQNCEGTRISRGTNDAASRGVNDNESFTQELQSNTHGTCNVVNHKNIDIEANSNFLVHPQTQSQTPPKKSKLLDID